MGNTQTAEEGVEKLKLNTKLIKKYIEISSFTHGSFGYNCMKTIIPGKEIDFSSNFYLFNIEGFFDIEKGIFFTLKKLIYMINYFNTKKIETKSYQDFSCKINSFFYVCDLLRFSYEKYNEIKENNADKFDTENLSLLCIGINFIRNYQPAINFLERIIPFEEFKGYASSIFQFVEGGIEITQGICKVIKIVNAVKNKNLPSIIFNCIEGIYYFFEGEKNIKNSINDMKNNYNNKNYTNAQNNLNQLLNKMSKMFDDLNNHNFKELYENNVIILAIDETQRNSEGVHLDLINVSGIDYYAKCLNDNDIERVKYIKNLFILDSELKLNISNDIYDKDPMLLSRLYTFMIFIQQIILKEYNDKNFWLNMDKSSIQEFVNDKKYEFYSIFNEIMEKISIENPNEIENIIKNEIYKKFNSKKLSKANSFYNNAKNKNNEKTDIHNSSSTKNINLNKKNEVINNNKEIKSNKSFYSTTNSFYNKRKNQNNTFELGEPAMLPINVYYSKNNEHYQKNIYKKRASNTDKKTINYKKRNNKKIIENYKKVSSLNEEAPPPIKMD